MSKATPVVEHAEACSLYTNEELKKINQHTAQRTAVLIVHGMGQQRRFVTLSQAASGIERVAGPAKKKRVRNVRIGDEAHVFSRLELDLPDGRGVDVYEGYWAPITEGAVNIRDVLSFLLRGALKGIQNAHGWRRMKFKRWVFGALHDDFPVGEYTRSILLLLLGFILSLLFLNSVMGGLATVNAMKIGPGAIRSPGIVHDFTVIVLMFLAVGAGFGAIYLVTRAIRQKDEHLTGDLLVSWLGLAYLITATVYTCYLGLVTALALGIPHWEKLAKLKSIATMSGLILTIVTMALLVFAGIVCLAASRFRTLWMTLGFAVILFFLAASTGFLAAYRSAIPELSIFDRVPHWVAPWSWWDGIIKFIASSRLAWGILWIALLGLSGFVRNFLVQFIGDVAAYLTPSKLDRFDEIRSRIKARMFDVANAIYRGGKNDALLYDSVVIIGHSLGSIAGYDVLNRMLNEDAHAGGVIGVLNRTKGFVTFGSFLDKTAFIFDTNFAKKPSADRAALAATVQPLIEDRNTLKIPWTNVYSPWDIFAGQIDYYNAPKEKNRVNNVQDFDAVTPIGAHTEYWDNSKLWECVGELIPSPVAGIAPPGPSIPIATTTPPLPLVIQLDPSVKQITIS